MPVRRRITKTVTEDFNETEDTLLPARSPTVGSSSPSLQEIKANPTRMVPDDDEEASIPERMKGPLTGDARRFSADLKAWFGHHSFAILATIFLAIGSIVALVWAAAERQTKTATVLDVVERSVRELSEQNRSITERLVRVEVQVGDVPKARPTVPASGRK